MNTEIWDAQNWLKKSFIWVFLPPYNWTLLMCTSWWPTLPFLPRTRARPASLRSRSNQVIQMPPPYFSAPTLIEPLSLLSERFFTRRQGESVCAPIRVKPAAGVHLPPTAKAVILDWFLVTKNLSPGLTFQWSRWSPYRYCNSFFQTSDHSLYPAATKIFRLSSTAW